MIGMQLIKEYKSIVNGLLEKFQVRPHINYM